MKKAIGLLIITALILPGCKFINEKILKKGEDLEVVTEQLKKDLEQMEADHEKELREIKQISQAKIDSIINYYENELASRGPTYGTVGAGTYYLVAGSFKTPEYAEDYNKKINEMGYSSLIVQMGHWNFVTAETYTSWREAVEGLEIVRSSISPDAWILVGR
jgi:hypothetical protein